MTQAQTLDRLQRANSSFSDPKRATPAGARLMAITD
jgi:hypothetical protein